MALELRRIPADAGFWPACARAVLDFAAHCGAPPRRLDSIDWLVPAPAVAAEARSALRAALDGAAFLPPRILPPGPWLGAPLRSGVAARAELFAALRDNAFVRGTFGTQPASLWGLADAVAELGDELTWAAFAAPEAFDGRLAAALARHFHRRAARVLEPQGQLVLQLWRARRDADDGPAAALRTLAARRAEPGRPLVITLGPQRDATTTALLAFAEGAARAVLVLQADVAQALQARPVLAAAWPELAGTDGDVPVADRADAVRGAPRPPLRIVPTDSLEEEAAAVAEQVLAWRRAGVATIGLVALDRLTARRVRALLERAAVRVRDETGWRLSTTSAAAAVMRWYDLVTDDLYWRDLLDWLKSVFTLGDWPHKARDVMALDTAIRAAGAVQGMEAMRRALAICRDPAVAAAGAGPAGLLALLEREVDGMRRTRGSLHAQLQALQAALTALGMRAPLAADPVGAAVLAELDALDAELAGVRGRASLAEFRALLAARFEAASFVDAAVDSPVVLLSLGAAAMRRLDAVLLIGADAGHLPAVPNELLFMSNAVRRDLGLATAQDEQHTQAAQLAMLLATTPAVVATWRRRRGDEPGALAAPLERLQFVVARATGVALDAAPARARVPVVAEPFDRPAPAAPALLPTRLSAQAAQALVDCAYRFYARWMLRLQAREDVMEAPDKRDYGTALHEVLRRFHAEYGAAAFEQLPADELAERLRLQARAVFEPQQARAPGMLDFARRFDGLVPGYIAWLQQHSAAGWRWQAGEASLERPFELSEGRSIDLVGRIDRVDGRGEAALVLDYKAKRAEVLKKQLQVPGEDVQLPFYGLLLPQRVGDAAYLAFGRARDDDGGVELVPAADFEPLVEQVGTLLRDGLQRVAAGAPLPALGVEAVCRYCEMRGLCRRDHWHEPADDDE